MVIQPRIYVIGASCSGVTTLGIALSQRLDIVHVDVDDYFWMPTDPPYRQKRPTPQRVPLIRSALGEQGWVLTGAFDGWGDDLIENADLIIFMTVPTPVRMARLVARESRRFGARIEEGGDMHRTHTGFRQWASQYDEHGFMGRSRDRHECWLAEQLLPILRLDGTAPLGDLVDEVIAALEAGPAAEWDMDGQPLPF